MSIKSFVHNGVATIEIARPEKKNAITGAMYQAMSAALLAAQADPLVRAVLITGQPGIFTSGNDIEDFMARAPGPGEGLSDSPPARFMSALMGCEKPVIAAVTGAAIGIGATMLLHCDFVYVSDEARLAMPFVSLGLVPEFASSLIVPRLMGHVKAAEKLLLGDPFTAEDAVEMRIANAVLPAGEVLNHARRIAERFNGERVDAPTGRTAGAVTAHIAAHAGRQRVEHAFAQHTASRVVGAEDENVGGHAATKQTSQAGAAVISQAAPWQQWAVR